MAITSVFTPVLAKHTKHLSLVPYCRRFLRRKRVWKRGSEWRLSSSGSTFSAETYVVVSGFNPMFISTLVSDMRAEDPYVSNFLGFSFNHYMSPQQVNPVFYNTYLGYLSTQTVETTPQQCPRR